MKKVFLNVLACFLMLPAICQTRAQILDYTTTKNAVDSIADELADIALQNPQLTALADQVKASEYSWKASKYDLLDNISVAGNLNEFSIKGSNPNGRNFYYPRYNVGVRATLGQFFSTGKTQKANFYKYQSDVERLKDARQNIKAQVKTAYQNYALTQKLLAFQEEVLQDGLIAINKAEEKFKNGELSLELYTDASRKYNSDLVRKATLERDLRVQQATLEDLIGMTLDDAFRQIKATNP